MKQAVQNYDLSTPAPLPRESAKRLAALQESFAEVMRIHLRRLLRLRTEVKVTAPDVARVRHFANFLAGKAWWFAGGSKGDPTGRSVLVGCAPGLIYTAIDRTLGGAGKATTPARLPTAIEFELGTRFLREVFDGLAGALALAPLHLLVAPHEALAEPLLTYLPDLEEPYARIAWKVKVFEQEHELLLCISRRLLAAAEPKDVEARVANRNLSAPVAGAPIELMVELARCRLRVDEAAKLEKGDVVLFDLPPGEPIDVKVQGKTRFRARLGTHDGRYAVEVVDVTEPAPPAEQARAQAQAAGAATSGKPPANAKPAAPAAATPLPPPAARTRPRSA